MSKEQYPGIWDVYQQHLLPLGHGLPLWNPEPLDYNQPIMHGSVLLRSPEGCYMQLFNASKERSTQGSIPFEYETFSPPKNSIFTLEDAIKDSVLFSKSISSRKISVSSNAGIRSVFSL